MHVHACNTNNQGRSYQFENEAGHEKIWREETREGLEGGDLGGTGGEILT